MAKLPSVSTITTGYASVQALNDNFEALKTAFTNTVSRDGSTPNSMSADLDLNSNDVKNVKTIDADKFILDGTLMTPSGVDPVYSGTISTLGANLIDDTTGDAMLDTMGITASVAQLNYSNGVTSSIQSQLDTLNSGKQAADDILTDLSGLTQAANKIPYFDTGTTASTLDFKDEDNMSSNSATAVPSQQSVKAYVDALASFSSSNGSFNHDSGLQIRFGTFSSTTDVEETITFTEAFDTACLVVVTSFAVQITNRTTTSFVSNRLNDHGNGVCDYIAIGY